MYLECVGDAVAVPIEEEEAKTPWVVILPFSLPGEVVRAKVYRNARMHSVADLVEVITPNLALRDDSRVQCRYFSKCGGCQYQVSRLPPSKVMLVGYLFTKYRCFHTKHSCLLNGKSLSKPMKTSPVRSVLFRGNVVSFNMLHQIYRILPYPPFSPRLVRPSSTLIGQKSPLTLKRRRNLYSRRNNRTRRTERRLTSNLIGSRSASMLSVRGKCSISRSARSRLGSLMRLLRVSEQGSSSELPFPLTFPNTQSLLIT